MLDLSLCVITANEAPNIEGCLGPFRDRSEIIVVDSFSKDDTVQRAQRFTPNVYSLPFLSFCQQKNFALSKARCEWVFFLDADERVSEALFRELAQTVARSPAENGFFVRRENTFLGARVRFGGNENDYHLRLFRRAEGKYFNAVHEVPAVRGKTGRFQATLLHESTRTLAHYWEKLDLYTSRSVRDARVRQDVPSIPEIAVKPVAKFFWLYGVRQGFRDGWPGLAYSALSSWNAFVEARAIRRACVKERMKQPGVSEVFRRALRVALLDGEKRDALESVLGAAGIPYDIVPPRSVFSPEEYPAAVLSGTIARGMETFFQCFEEGGGILIPRPRAPEDIHSVPGDIQQGFLWRGIPLVIGPSRGRERFTAEWRKRFGTEELWIRRISSDEQPLALKVLTQAGVRHVMLEGCEAILPMGFLEPSAEAAKTACSP